MAGNEAGRGHSRALVETLGQASQAATQIVASSGQQATGMAQVQQAMGNIDQVSRQNLAATRPGGAGRPQNLNKLAARNLAGFIGEAR